MKIPRKRIINSAPLMFFKRNSPLKSTPIALICDMTEHKLSNTNIHVPSRGFLLAILHTHVSPYSKHSRSCTVLKYRLCVPSPKLFVPRYLCGEPINTHYYNSCEFPYTCTDNWDAHLVPDYQNYLSNFCYTVNFELKMLGILIRCVRV